jgi:PAS domain S-box-containing protein
MTPKSSYHKLLQRQIKKVQSLSVTAEEKLDLLMDLVHDSYNTYDKDINHLKTVIRESSTELLESNEQLKKAHAEIADAYTNEVGLLNNLIDKSGEAVQVSTEDGVMVYINEKGAQRLQRSKDDILGKFVGEVEKTFSSKQDWALHVSQLKNNGPMIIEGLHKKADGTEFPIEANAYYTEIGSRGYVIAFIRDITERKKIESQLLNSLTEKTTLLGEIHHRVKNNLTVIFGLLEMQILQSDNNEVIKILRESQGRIQSMSMIHEMLYKTTDLQNVNLTAYIRDLAQTIYRTYHTNDNIHLEIRNETEIGLSLNKMIPCGLLLNEILTNAYKYAFNGRENGTIFIDTQLNDGQLILVIGDDGTGLPEIETSIKTHSLGMKLIHSFSKQLKAKMTIDNSVGVKYTFQIPLN